MPYRYYTAFWVMVVQAVVWSVVQIRGFARRQLYRADRRGRLGLPRRVRLAQLADPELKAVLEAAAELRKETAFVIDDCERQLAYGSWSRFFPRDYDEQVTAFLDTLAAAPEPVRRHLLESGVSESRLAELGPLYDWIPAGRDDLKALRKSRIAFLRELDRSFRLSKLGKQRGPYRELPGTG